MSLFVFYRNLLQLLILLFFESDNDFIQITVKLIEKGYTEEDIAKIWGGNLMRVLDEVQATASVKTL